MKKWLKKFINLFEVDLRNSDKNKQFHKSLKELVSILFAVVFGVGLAQLGKTTGAYDLCVLILAYLAIILSWWGYHYGTIAGRGETNALNYGIDCILLAVYWFLINKRAPLLTVLMLYWIMFALYVLWELIRQVKAKEGKVKKAFIVNCIFFCVILSMWVSNFLRDNRLQLIQNWHYILTLFILIIVYRVIIHFVYLSKKPPIISFQVKEVNLENMLVKKARDVAANARIHLSDFAVGAAILTDTDKMYVGCNVEFDNYSNTIHAEEAAISAAIAAGEKQIKSIAVFTFSDSISFPCGMCRQSLFELGGKDLRVIACNDNTCEVKTMEELLPFGFHL